MKRGEGKGKYKGFAMLPPTKGGRRLWGTVWRRDSALASINEVDLHRARLVLGWVTVSGFISRCGNFISVCNQLSRSTDSAWTFFRG